MKYASLEVNVRHNDRNGVGNSFAYLINRINSYAEKIPKSTILMGIPARTRKSLQ